MEDEFTVCKSDSRRSIDWRDSGIVIDEDQVFNSFEEFNNYYHQLSTTNKLQQQQSSNNTDPIQTLNSQANKTTNFNSPDYDGDTILHIAVVAGFTIDKVRSLVKICDLNAINNMIQTPLHVATMANRPEMVELLISSGAEINIRDRRGNTPLHLACQKGFKEVALVILSSINKKELKRHLEMANFDGLTCLHLAASRDRSIVDLLVTKYNANINSHDSKSGSTIMHNSISAYNVDLISFILSFEKHCNEPDFYGRRPLKTIKILTDSTLDSSKIQKLSIAKRLVRDRIELCIEKGGCCTEEELDIDSDDSSDSSSLSSTSSDYCKNN